MNAKNIVDWSPLHYAVTRESLVKDSHEKIITDLIQHGADLDAKDIADLTPLHYAALHGNTRVAELLLRQGAQSNIPSRSGMLPIHCAVKGGSLETVNLFISIYRMDINAVDHIGWTPLHYAVWNGHDSMVELLLTAGAGVNCEDKFGVTALLRAIQNNQPSIVELFLRLLPETLHQAVQF
ncbi:Similar to Serine/threonine-protein phosphatase 6 regulatory ankyrin repeat subunit B; acc. no. B2RXR6 [Pyronema omphalodes CBS 100304]|uniref:Similar to Serine/threonine-protein phosphatase 6 regulatory ankyrin repeat subunit B acc. no. B2RXR6 n=1 Tax=Pyronema omphalodes (strain CBS 100304) TaxID=1076935 RepID=U4LTN0_PYROM|nr:Similar to Serine/threonine-protein phosphatase 6 regulatory ankyrin repeat subunit B; acc. no. B2RXR6 [Pyronema omphalodes CBS 100304]